MENIILNIVFGTFVIIAYTLGLRNGQKIVQNKTIEVPHPIKDTKDYIETKKNQKKEEEKFDEYKKLFDNIDNYDKPGYHQQEVNLDE